MTQIAKPNKMRYYTIILKSGVEIKWDVMESIGNPIDMYVDMRKSNIPSSDLILKSENEGQTTAMILLSEIAAITLDN